MDVVLILLVFIVLFIVSGVKVVAQAESIVIERLGTYHKTLTSGLHIIWPIIDKPRMVDWRYNRTDPSGRTFVRREQITRVDLRETVYDFPKQNVITRDNVAIEINAMIYFQIVDPKRVVYEIANLPDAIEKLTQTTLRNIIGEMEFDHTLTSRETINGKLRIVLDEASDKWGVKVNRVELQDIIPPADIKAAMEKQMRAERDRRAIILEAEGQKQAAILTAEGQKQAEINKAEGIKQSMILRAEGEAQARVQVATAEGEAINLVTAAISSSGGDPSSYLIAVKYIEALQTMVSGKDNKTIYIPYEATGVLGALGGIKEIFSKLDKPAQKNNQVKIEDAS